MSFHPRRLSTLGAASLGTLALGACTDPVADTDLRPEGDPEVLAVLVFNDTAHEAVESATYCKANDPKRPSKVGIPAYGLNPTICPLDGSPVEPLRDAWPNQWYVRVMFDELLDPEVETLEPILDNNGNPTENFTGSLARTQPVTLRCQGVGSTGPDDLIDVDYDGWYSPAGNRVTWPLGPGLVIRPLDPTIVPVESRCVVALKPTIKDKDGNPVAGRDLEPFEFYIAPVSVISVEPSEDSDPIDPSVGNVHITFNVSLDSATSFCADSAMPACFGITPAANAANPVVAFEPDTDNTVLNIAADLLGDQTYQFRFPESFKIKDKCGKESSVASVPEGFEFKTNAARFTSFNPGGGSAVAPAKNIVLNFNQKVNAQSVALGTDFEISPMPANLVVEPLPEMGMPKPTTSVTLRGDYDLATTYTLTMKAGASVSDFFGKQTIDFPTSRMISFTTAPTITFVSQSPANNAEIERSTDPDAPFVIELTFNQDINGESLEANDFTLTKADGSAIPNLVVDIGPKGSMMERGATVTIKPEIMSGASTSQLPAGAYKFVLKKGAKLNDNITPQQMKNIYEQTADRTINFTIVESEASPGFKCLGQP